MPHSIRRQLASTYANNKKPKTMKKPKPEHQLWIDSCTTAIAALEELIALQADYQSEYDDMTESQHESKRGECLDAICTLDLEGALDTVRTAAELELP